MQELQRKLGDYTMFSINQGGVHHNRHGSYGNSTIEGVEAAQSMDNRAGAAGHFSPDHVMSPMQNPRFLNTGEFADPRNGMLSSVTKSGRGFREKILRNLSD